MTPTPIIYTKTDFPSRDLLYPYKDEMVEYYFEKMRQYPEKSKYSWLYTNNVVETNIIPRVKKILKNSFRVNVGKIVSRIYIQNNEYCVPYFHHHMRCTPKEADASLTAALYLDPPKVGGEFQFMPRLMNPETFEDDLKEHTFEIEENKLYFFPSWWMHRPLPQEDETYRVCLTFDIYSFDRPEFLPGKVIW